ncbi:MAG: hypothetical protein ACRYHA_10755 [Janthinobacterium lividum]
MTSLTPLLAVSRPAFDDSAFPVVLLAGAGAQGHAFAWGATMRRLLARKQPFVIVQGSDRAIEHPDDRRARRCWIRAHATGLQTYCLGLVAVEPDIERRSRTRLSLSELVEPLALRVLVVSTEALARQLADVLLMGARPVVTAPVGDGGNERRGAALRRLVSVR